MAFMIRAIIGPNAISCDKGRDGTEYLFQEGLESTWCIIVFLLMYFFGMASQLWWVIKCIANRQKYNGTFRVFESGCIYNKR
jgi:hypothetical protein